MLFRSKKIFYTIFILSISLSSFSQTPNDGFNNRTINTYKNKTEVARQTIRFTDGFSTLSPQDGDLHAYINELLPPMSTDTGNFNMNYIRVYTAIKDNKATELPNFQNLDYNKWALEVQYFDGLGRPIQTVKAKASPLGYDIVQPIVYDAYGRENKKYLPYTINTETVGIAG